MQLCSQKLKLLTNLLITCQIKHWPQKMKNLEDEINESVSGLIDEQGINLRPDLRKSVKNSNRI